MKELNGIALRKGLFASIKGQRCLTKGHLGNQEGHVQAEHPLIKNCFSTFPFKFKKTFFCFKKGTI